MKYTMTNMMTLTKMIHMHNMIRTTIKKFIYNFDDADENDSYAFDEHNTYYYDNHDNTNDDDKDALNREEDVEESDDSNSIDDRHIKNKYRYSL